MILLDTDVMIDILGPQDNLRPFLSRAPQNPITQSDFPTLKSCAPS